MTARSWPHDDEHHAWWVAPGALLAGEYPANSAGSFAKLDRLLDAGVTSFVDLTTPEDGLHPYGEALRDRGAERGIDVRHLPHPIPDLSVIDVAGYRRIVDAIDAEVAEGRVAYVHCWGGVGRTGTVVGCWLMAHGRATGDDVGDRIAALRAGTRKAHRPCPEARVQWELLEAWAQGRGGSGDA